MVHIEIWAHLWDVTKATVVSRIAYSSPAWWGVLDVGSRQCLQALLTKIIKQSFLTLSHSTMKEICEGFPWRCCGTLTIFSLTYFKLWATIYSTCDSALTTESFPSLSLAVQLKELLTYIPWFEEYDVITIIIIIIRVCESTISPWWAKRSLYHSNGLFSHTFIALMVMAIVPGRVMIKPNPNQAHGLNNYSGALEL